MKKDYVRLIISDLHVGSYHSKENKIYDLLKTIEYDELILGGDIIDFIKIPTFTERSADLFELVSNTKAKVIYVVGNHDFSFKKFIGKRVSNVYFTDKYEFDYCGKKYRVEHGDAYEKGIVHSRFLMNIISVVQDFLERYFKYNLAAWLVRRALKKRSLKRIWPAVS